MTSWLPVSLCYAALSVVICAAMNGAAAQEDPLHIVAATVRDNGFVCDDPKSVTPDEEHSSPNEKAWVIDCGTETYRVKYKGDTGAEVEREND
jgi:hypothetical protein